MLVRWRQFGGTASSQSGQDAERGRRLDSTQGVGIGSIMPVAVRFAG